LRVAFTTAPPSRGAADGATRWAPLGLIHLAGAAQAAGHECVLLDPVSTGMGLPEARRRIADLDPQVLCVSAMTPGFPDAQELCRWAQAEGITTVVGGIHASFMYSEFLPQGGIDFAVVGEGEETLTELLRCLERRDDPSRVAGVAFSLGGRTVRTARRPHLAPLDPLPAAWDLVDWSLYTWAGRPGSRLAAVATSRGCPRSCRSCPQAATWECTWRGRSPDCVAYELSQLRAAHGVEVVALFDDAPTWDAQRWVEILERLVELDLGVELLLWTRAEEVVRDADRLALWRRAGVRHVGLCRDPEEEWEEGRVAEVARAAGPRAVSLLRDHGMTSEATFWLGFPDDTPARVGTLQSRAQAWDPDVAHFRFVAPWPYTPAWRTLGPHAATRDYRRYDGTEPVVKPRHMATAELAQAMSASYRGFYLDRVRRSACAGSAAVPTVWQPLLDTSFFRDHVLPGATEDERRALAATAAS
jgi:anaerobic magnesium-protoporphyrin IX monomethyl ester cyclase